MSVRRPSLPRRMWRAYWNFWFNQSDRLESFIYKTPLPPPLPTSLSGEHTPPAPPPVPVRSPAAFTGTAARLDFRIPRMFWHWLGLEPEKEERRVFWLQDGDDVSAFRVLDDRQFGGRTEARVSVAERRGDDGSLIRSLLYDGYLHPLPPFASATSRWKEDIVRPPSTPPPASSPHSPLAVGPTGLSTPPGLLNGFSSLTSPDYEFPDLNLQHFTHLALTLRTDGRPYVFSLRCKEHDRLVYQVRVPGDPELLATSASAPSLPPFATKSVRFEQFLSTFQGRMRLVQMEMPRHRVASFGFSVNGPPGPFRLELESMDAKKGLTAYEKRTLEQDELDREQEAVRGKEKLFWWLTDEEQARIDGIRRPKQPRQQQQADGDRQAELQQDEDEDGDDERQSRQELIDSVKEQAEKDKQQREEEAKQRQHGGQ